MLRRDAGQSVSFFDGFRSRDFFHVARGFLPFLAMMLLAAPQLALGQGGVTVTVNPRTLEVTEGATNTYTVVLDAAPSANVTITVVGTDGTDLTVDPSPLTFTAPTDPNDITSGTWDEPQTVTVTAGDDFDAVSETVTLTHTATIGTDDDSIALANSSVRVTIDDNDEQGVTITGSPLTVAEGATTSYTVVLTSEPTDTVTVDVGGVSGDITVSPSRLFFMPGAGIPTAQTVTVYAGEDQDADDDTATLTHTVRGGDYTGVAAMPVSVPVTVTDDDDARRLVTVAPTSLNIAAGARGTFSVVLGTQPAGSVTITVAESSDDFSVSRSSLSFSSSNWNRPQTVTVQVSSNATAAGSVDVENSINTSSSSRDMAYDSVTVANVGVTVSDSEPAVRLSTSSVTINEGSNATYTVRLGANPGVGGSETVTVNAGSGFTVDQSSLTFAGPTTDGATDATWNTAQTVTVTGPDDENAVAETATITHTIGGAIVANGILQATIRESDTRGVTVLPTSLEVTEAGTAVYSVLLDSEPAGDSATPAENKVTVTVGGVSGDVTVSPSQLLFTGGNWNQAQEVTVTAAADDDGATDDPVTLTHTVRGADYQGTRADNVRVTIKETDTRGIIVDTTPNTPAATSSLTVAEGGTGMYTVALESQPTATVTVMVRGASGDVSVSPSRLIFTTGNWDNAQTVEVKASQDDDAVQDPVVTLTHVASGGGYSAETSVTVTVTEDDNVGVRITPTALTVTEGMPGTSYTVVLTTEPTGPVTMTLCRVVEAGPPQVCSEDLTNPTDESLVVNPRSLRFTRGNWKTPQTVTVRAAEDDNAADGTVILDHLVNGGGYDAVDPLNVSVTINDNDTAEVVVSTTTIEIAEGTRRTYTVALGSQPTENVDVTITGSSTITVSPTSLPFTPANWSTPRTVTVHVADGTAATTETLTHTASTGGYTPATITVTVRNGAGVAINPTSLEITEGERESYTVVLTAQPTATVNVNIAGAAGDVQVSRTRVSFSTSTWNREQTVTVSLAEDDDAV